MELRAWQETLNQLKDLINRLTTIQNNQKALRQKLTKDLDIAKDKIEALELKVKQLESHKKIFVILASIIGILLGLVLRDLAPYILNLFSFWF